MSEAVERIMRVHDLMGGMGHPDAANLRSKIEAHVSSLYLQGERDVHQLAMKGLIFLRSLGPSGA